MKLGDVQRKSPGFAERFTSGGPKKFVWKQICEAGVRQDIPREHYLHQIAAFRSTFAAVLVPCFPHKAFPKGPPKPQTSYTWRRKTMYRQGLSPSGNILWDINSV